MKKIAISSNIIWTIANFRHDLIADLKAKGYDVLCISSPDEFSDISEKILHELGARHINVSLNRKGLNPLADFSYFSTLLKIYRNERPDVVLHFTIKPNIYGTLAAKIAGIPSINTVNGLGSAFIKGGLLASLLKQMYRFSFKFSHRILFQNRADMQYFITHHLANQKKCRYVPGSGIDTEYFSGCEKQTGTNITFLMIARLLKDKGIYEYIAACRQLKQKYSNVRCLLAGVLDKNNPTAVKQEELDIWIEEGVIEYLGKTDHIKEFFQETDIVVLPSYREGLSRVLLEGASCAKPIITTDVPGCRELVVEEESGFICRHADINSLQEAMEKMLNVGTRIVEMGERGRHHIIEKFSKEKVNRVYAQVLKEILG